MPTYDWNIKTWGETYNWGQEGEEWSSAWGNSETQWFSTLLPRLHRFLPCENVLEIAPGFGRWTKFLLPLTIGRYVGVDISESCIAHCNEKFKSDKASFFQNDGFSLKQAYGRKYDLIFSFDSLVHADINVLKAYIEQALELLASDGVCFIHHSNFGQIRPLGIEKDNHPGYTHCRDQSSTASEVKEYIAQMGGKVLIQELVNWGCDSLIDCFTVFSLKDSKFENEIKIIENYDFMKEAYNCRKHLSNYVF